MTTEGTQPVSSRPYWALRAETKLNLRVVSLLKRLGWRERIEPFVGYGAEPGTTTRVKPALKFCEQDPSYTDDSGWVRILARVMVAPQKRGLIFRNSASRAQGDLRLVRGWRSFINVEAPFAEITVTVGKQPFQVRSDPGGYVDVVLPAHFAAGWHEVTLTTSAGVTSVAAIQVLSTGQRTGLVSDIDDTAIVTSVPRPLLAAWNSLVVHESARSAVPGMVQLYDRLDSQYGGLPVFYLSTSPWNVAPGILRFFKFHGFPAGALLMTDFGPTNTGWFRSGKEHKLRSLDRLARDFPTIKWVLIGDDGQRDPEIYDKFSQTNPQNVAGIAIRQLSPAEAVLAHGTVGERDPHRTTQPCGPHIAFKVRGKDGHEIAGKLERQGILPRG